MNLAPDTATIEAQRSTELLLLDYLRSTNPHTYALWCGHPEYGTQTDSDSSSSSSSSGASTSTSGSSSSAPQPGSTVSPASVGNGAQYREAQFHRAAHVDYACSRLQELPTSLQGMYPSRPWVAYWCLQAAEVLGVADTDLLVRTPAADITAFLHSCLSHDHTCEAELRADDAAAKRPPSTTPCTTEGESAGAGGDEEDACDIVDATARPAIGFAGGPLHLGPHLAASYAACSALAILAARDDGASLRHLPRAAIKRWLLTLRNADGSFRVHGGGESDIRASYCAAVLTSLLCLDDPATFNHVGAHQREYVADVQHERVLTPQTARFVAACQTHEGGFTCSATASEAHGAYTQCGLAALLLMKQPHLVHQASLRRWLAARQLTCEGGFNGRTNKLVDSCYSHWIGAAHVLLRVVEAYTKCFAAVHSPGSDAAEATSAYLRAREVVLLDHAQLLDAALLQTTEDAAWEEAEAAHFQRLDAVDQLLSADDGCLRDAAAKRHASSELYDAVLRASFATPATTEASKAAEARKAGDAAVASFHTRQAFLYADVGDYYFNQRKLQDYVLRCCQDAEIGGLMDKPGTAHDAYHTCYSLSGVSAAQNLQYLTHATAAAGAASPASPSYLQRAFARSYLPKRSATDNCGVVLSLPCPSPAAETAVLRTTSPIFNIHQSGVLAALRVWSLKSFL